MIKKAFRTQPFTLRQPRTEAERADRVQRETAMIAQAEADIDAGLGIGNFDLKTWLDEFDRDNDAWPPTPLSF